jgi:hypothetical protein
MFVSWLSFQIFVEKTTQPHRRSSLLEILEQLYNKTYSEVRRIKFATLMLCGKAQVWLGQFKVDWEVYNQPQVGTWMEYRKVFMAQYMQKDYCIIFKEEMI